MDIDYSLIKQNFGTDYVGALRHMRDILLKESDWTQFTDSPLTDSKKTEWKTYRQQLRDLPHSLPTNKKPKLVLDDEKTHYVISNVTWPTEPSE